METEKATSLFAALSYDSRLNIFRFLVRMGPEGASAGEIAEACAITSSTLSHHLNQMRLVGLVERKRESRSLIYSANFEAMNELVGFLTNECCHGQPELCNSDT